MIQGFYRFFTRPGALKSVHERQGFVHDSVPFLLTTFHVPHGQNNSAAFDYVCFFRLNESPKRPEMAGSALRLGCRLEVRRELRIHRESNRLDVQQYFPHARVVARVRPDHVEGIPRHSRRIGLRVREPGLEKRVICEDEHVLYVHAPRARRGIVLGEKVRNAVPPNEDFVAVPWRNLKYVNVYISIENSVSKSQIAHTPTMCAYMCVFIRMLLRHVPSRPDSTGVRPSHHNLLFRRDRRRARSREPEDRMPLHH